jgi:hypothetical protein
MRHVASNTTTILSDERWSMKENYCGRPLDAIAVCPLRNIGKTVATVSGPRIKPGICQDEAVYRDVRLKRLETTRLSVRFINCKPTGRDKRRET